MSKFLTAALDSIQRYPVLFFGAVGAWVRSKANIETGGADDLALTATILWLQSAFSRSKKSAEEDVDAVKSDTAEKVEQAKYTGAVQQQATMLAHQAIVQRPIRAPR